MRAVWRNGVGMGSEFCAPVADTICPFFFLKWFHALATHEPNGNDQSLFFPTFMKIKLPLLCRTLAVMFLSLAVGQNESSAQIFSMNCITNNGSTNNPIGLRFTQPVSLPSATNVFNYKVNAGTVSVTNVILQTNGLSVTLELASPVGEFFSVSVSNVLTVASNVLNALGTGFVSDFSSTTVGVPGDPDPAGEVATGFWDSFDVTVGGSEVGGVSDSFQFVHEEIGGDFDVRTLVTRLDLADPLSQAGLMARETLTPDSATIQTYFTPPGGSNEIEVAVRSVAAGSTTDAGFQIGPRAPATPLRWLRMTRTNNVFTAYYGTNGVGWSISGVTTQTFSTNLLVGLMTCSHNNGTATTASFTDVLVRGARPGDAVVPTLSAALVGTNIVVQWPKTRRSFALQVTDNLGVSNEWGILVAPYQLNTNQWRLNIPLGSLGNQLFIRATRVERLIPQFASLFVNAGVILSSENGFLTPTTLSGSFCAPIDPATAFAQLGDYVLFTSPKSSTASVDTLQSTSDMDTVLRVRNKLDGISTTCNDNASSSEKKSKVRPLPNTANGSAKFTFVVGARNGTTPTSVFLVWCSN